jgi:hypothetical protein
LQKAPRGHRRGRSTSWRRCAPRWTISGLPNG